MCIELIFVLGVGQSELDEEESSDDYVSDPEELYRDRPIDEEDEEMMDERTTGEGAETGTIKRKPSHLDRSGKQIDNLSQTRNQPSPPKSPKSPSWIKYKDSPPRSPTIKIASPTKSPTETFPSSYSDLSPDEGPDAETYASIFGYSPERTEGPEEEDTQFYYPDNTVTAPPPKPARASDHYEFQDDFPDEGNMASHSLDIASFAAAIATDTEHMTNMSVSPTRGHPTDSGSDSTSSQEYFEEDLEVSEPTPKNIDYQNSKRQKVRPPANDWSPVTDLSPILDVSPSVERMEQEQMLAEQMFTTDETGMAAEGQRTVVRAPKRQLQHSEGAQIQRPEIHVTRQLSEESKDDPRKRRALPSQPQTEKEVVQKPPATILGQREAVIQRLQKEFREECQSQEEQKESRVHPQQVDPRAHSQQLDSRGHPQQLYIKETMGGGVNTASYNVLKSPISPGKKVEYEEDGTRLESEEPVYMYPSPCTPPDLQTSPPKPRSPSGPRSPSVEPDDADIILLEV